MQRCTLRKDDERPTNTVRYERAGWASHMDTLWTEPESERDEREKEGKTEREKERGRERETES